MSQPTTLAELNARQKANMRIEGYGADTRSVIPCPFCGAPDWLIYPVTAALNDYADLATPHACAECGRSARLVTTRHQGGVSQELVQCGGSPAPDFIWPPPRYETPTGPAGGQNDTREK